MDEWQRALREELRSELVAYREDGREAPVRLDFDFKDGTASLEWRDGENQRWHLTIPYATLMALTDVMVKRLYPSARLKRRGTRQSKNE
jgi:hypothetical protein